MNRRLWREMEATAEIAAWDPPNAVTVKVVRGPIPFESTYAFEAQGDGTQLSFRSQADVDGLLQWLIRRQFEGQLLGSITARERVLEAGKME